MTNFGGWAMPLQYSTIREEHRAVREAVGLFDLSHMGELRVTEESLVQRLTKSKLGDVKYYAFVDGTVADVPCLISRTGYTGEDGFELFCGSADAVRLWRALLEEGRSDGIRPAGLGARDTLRLEAGMRLYGKDMDAGTHPPETGLGGGLNLHKDIICRGAHLTRWPYGVFRSLVGFKV